MQDLKQQQAIAISIIFGSFLIALALYFANMTDIRGAIENQGAIAEISGDPRRADESIRNVYGEKDAETTIVEFSDFECPFCSRLHLTLKKIVDESEGEVNWEYRHLPLAIHRNAQPAAVASECVAKLAGREEFWRYVDLLYVNQNNLAPEVLKEHALSFGVEDSLYDGCIIDPAMAAIVEGDVGVAQRLGGSGTPFSVILFPDGSTRTVSGALPYQQWYQVINSTL